MKKEEIEQRLIENKQERKQLKQQLKDLPSLEVGRWYKYNDGVFNYQGVKCYIQGYGIDVLGIWLDVCNLGESPQDWIPATDKEVEEALIKEAKKRGFKKGVEFISLRESKEKVFFSSFWQMDYSKDLWVLGSKSFNGIIFKDGKWAEIIQPKTVELNGNYTEVQLKDILNSQF